MIKFCVKNYQEFKKLMEFFGLEGLFGTQIVELSGWHKGIYYPPSTEILIKVV